MAWIEKTKNGLRYVERIKVDGKYKRISTPIEKDTAQARRAAAERLLDKQQRICAPLCETTLKEAIERYIAREGIRESSRIHEGSALGCALNMIGNVKMCELSAPFIKRKLLESGRKPKTLNGKLRYVKSLLRWCLEYGYIENDFVGRLRNFPMQEERKDPLDLYLEPDELQEVLSRLTGMPYYAAKFLALTGCRVGEMSALQMSDISDTHITISKSYSPSTHTIGEPKNVNSHREIFIQPELAEFLKEYKEWRLLYMVANGIRTDLLFFNPSGDIYVQNSLYQQLRKIDHKITPHIFRHTHTALLADQGMSLEAIARRLGHGDSHITRKVYYHVTSKQKKKDEEAMAKVRIL